MTYEILQKYAALIGLLLFIIAFGVIVWQTYRPGAKRKHEEHGKIPFKEDDDNGK